MGNCNCHSGEQDKQEVLSGRPDAKDKKNDTITMPNQSGGTQITNNLKKSSLSQKGDYNEEDSVQAPQQEVIEPKKRGSKKKQANINAVQDHQEILENVKVTDKKKNPFDYQLILNACCDHFIFKSIPQPDMEYVVDKMFYCTVLDGQFVFKQGEKGSSYFLIERGQCQIIINGDLKKTLKSGEAFGELALLYNAPRSASVKALGDCAFWAIDRNTFRKVVETQNLKDYEENKNFIKNVSFFDFLTDDQRDSITSVLITQIFKKGEIIVNEGDQANSFYVIKKGKVAIIKGDKQIKEMKAGESFGEAALSQTSTRMASVKALDEEVRCLALGRDDLTRILGQKVQVAMNQNVQRWALEKNALLCNLTSLQIEKIVLNSRQVQYQENDVIVKAKTPCTKLLVVLEGEMMSTPSKKPIADKGKLFGEVFLQTNSVKEVPEDIIMKSKLGTVAEIEFKLVYELLGGTLEQILLKNKGSHEQKYMNRPSQFMKVDCSHIKLENLIAIKKLGQGQFGNVYLVKQQNEDKMYALKCISKTQIVEQHLERHLAQEKQVLSNINFPFLMTYYRSFKDNNYIYFLVEYIKGMELFDVIREIGLLSAQDSSFYIGSLLLCVEYLHKQGIIYRDIKPENIMVDEKGFLRMIDMGTAKYLNSKGARTYTIIGTPHYMAPEIITGKGYTFNVDLWSVGVCLYEFMCGGVPFAEDADDPYEIYEEISKKAIQYPGFFKDRRAKKLIEQLLSKTPETRLGGSYATLKANPWFDQFDWDRLMDRDLKTPFVPKKIKLVSDKDIAQAMQAGRPAYKEVQSGQQPYKKEKAKDQNWDKDY